jgi:hypothetical protein
MQNIETMATEKPYPEMGYTCMTLAHISVLPWCIPLLADSAACQSLVRILVYIAAHSQDLNVF